MNHVMGFSPRVRFYPWVSYNRSLFPVFPFSPYSRHELSIYALYGDPGTKIGLKVRNRIDVYRGLRVERRNQSYPVISVSEKGKKSPHDYEHVRSRRSLSSDTDQ